MNTITTDANRKTMKSKHMRPSQIVVISFALATLLGTALLNIPAATASGESIGFLDAFFTSASAVCVTGLVVVNTFAHWSLFGKIVILCLIQIGGLGIMTFIVAIVLAISRKITINEQLVIQASFNLNDFTGFLKLIKGIISITFCCEAAGAIILSIRFLFVPGQTLGGALFYGIFHSVSAFCNAGFDIIGYNSLVDYVCDPAINLIISILSIVGGIGFIVWLDIISLCKNIKNQPKIPVKRHIEKLSLHTKIVITVSFILILISGLYIFISEFNNPKTMGSLNVPSKLMASFFHAITLRTTGFSTVNVSDLHESTNFVSSLFMFIGGSPASTGGGVKTVTVAVVFFATVAVLRGNNSIEAFGRNISLEILQRSLAIIALLFMTIVAGTIALTFTESGSPAPFGFLDILIEIISACTTVGHSAGMTPYLSHMGKIIVILCMLIGRLGPVTLAVALSVKNNKTCNNLAFPEEKILIG